MNGPELTAYTIASIALAISFALYILSSRTPHVSRFTLHVSRFTLHVSRFTNAIATVALLSLCLGLAWRGIVARRWPLGSPFEFTLAFAASIILVYLSLYKTTPMPLAGAIAILLALLLLAYAFFIQPEAARAIQPLPLVMRGIWFALHTLFTVIACGALAVAGGVALLVLPSLSRAARPAPNEIKGSSIVASVLPLPALVDRAMAVGYIALSLGMIAGGIWGEQAWGEYWSWSIKETWTLITWWVCTFYYHVRRRRGWRGSRAMCIAVLALVAVGVTVFLTPSLLHWTRLQRWRIY